MSLIPASMASAIPSRAKILNVLETLVIGTAGGALFLLAHLPGGLISGAMIAVGVAAIAGRPLAVPPILTQTVLVLLGISLGSLVSRQLLQHVGAYPLTIGLLALATFCSTFGSQPLSAARPRLGPHLGVSGRKPRRAVADHHARHRARRRRVGDRGGADHARDHPHRGAADAAGADRDRAGIVAGAAWRTPPRRSNLPN